MNINKIKINLNLKNTILLLFILLAISIVINFLLYSKFKKDRVVIVKPQVEVFDVAGETVEKVQKLMLVPRNEKPQVFPINEKTPRNQDFIKDAKNGDILLLYINNKKAILYDPDKNQILKVGQLTFTSISSEIHSSN